VLDSETHVVRGHTIMVLNVGDFRDLGLSIGPGINPHDGVIDLAIVASRSLFGYASALMDILRKRHRQSTHIRYLRGHRMTVHTSRPLPVMVDGEMAGRTPIDVIVLPDAVRILVPPDYSGTRPAPGGERAGENGD
jgi:diacylglycerol kinase family enzyme